MKIDTDYITYPSLTTASDASAELEVTTVSWYTATLSWSTNHTAAVLHELHCVPINATGYNKTVIIDDQHSDYTFKVRNRHEKSFVFIWSLLYLS